MDHIEFQEDVSLENFYNDKMNKDLSITTLDVLYDIFKYLMDTLIFEPADNLYNYFTSNNWLIWVNPNHIPVPPPQPPPMAPPQPIIKSETPDDFEYVKPQN